MHYINKHKDKARTLTRRWEREVKGLPRTRAPRKGVQA